MIQGQRLWTSDTVSWSQDSHPQAVAGLGDRALHEHQVFEVQLRHFPSWACPSSQTLATTQLIYHVRVRRKVMGTNRRPSGRYNSLAPAHVWHDRRRGL